MPTESQPPSAPETVQAHPGPELQALPAKIPSADDYCLWEMDARDFHVGILGSGPGFMTMLDIISNEQYRDFLPGMVLVAVCEAVDQRKILHVQRRGIPVYDTCEAMLAAHPELDLIIELVGKRPRIQRLRSSLPAAVSLVDHVAAVFFCGMHTMLQAGIHCRRDLDRHKALLRAVMDEVNEDILLLDKERRVVDMNKTVRKRLAQGPGGEALVEELLGKSCHLVQTMENGKPFCPGEPDPACPFDETLAGGEKAECLLTRVDDQGKLVYYRVYTYPVRDSFGQMTHILMIRRNITARTLRERHQQQLDKLTMLGELSSYLAHEIRNPLFAIAGFTRSLQRSPSLRPEEREKVAIILEETERLDRMLKSMLDFARPTKDQVGECDLNRVAQQTVELMQIGYAQQLCSIELKAAPTLPLVRGDAEAVKQCLVNLIKNSLEAMPQGGHVQVRTGLDGQQVFVQVQDTGTGMSAQNMEKVFSPFYSTKPQGYGMGLAMIKKLVDELGGHVQLSSTLGEGTTVTLFFQPVLSGDAVESAPLFPPQPSDRDKTA